MKFTFVFAYVKTLLLLLVCTIAATHTISISPIWLNWVIRKIHNS